MQQRYPNTIDRVLLALPAVQIDKNLHILHVNEAAAACGVQTGEAIPCPPDGAVGDFHLLHEACFTGAADPLEESEKHLRLRITAFHGFHLAYITYEHSLQGNFAAAILFHSHREFLRFAPYLSERIARYNARLEAHFAALRQRCSALLRDETVSRGEAAGAVEEMLSTAMFILRVFTPLSMDQKNEKRLFSLSHLLGSYLSAVMPDLRLVDCHVEYASEPAEDISLPVDTSAMFLLWTSVLRILNDLSGDGRIRITNHRCGRDGEIRFSTVPRQMPPTASRISDLTVLSSVLPGAELSLILADYLAGVQDCLLDLYTDPAKGTLTVSLYIPEEKQIPDFKSPKEAEDNVAEALRCLRGLWHITARSSEAEE